MARVNIIFARVQEIQRARERVAVLLNDVWHNAMVKYGCVNPIILWIKFKFSRVKDCVLLEYSPIEGDGEEREVLE